MYNLFSCRVINALSGVARNVLPDAHTVLFLLNDNHNDNDDDHKRTDTERTVRHQTRRCSQCIRVWILFVSFSVSLAGIIVSAGSDWSTTLGHSSDTQGSKRKPHSLMNDKSCAVWCCVVVFCMCGGHSVEPSTCMARAGRVLASASQNEWANATCACLCASHMTERHEHEPTHARACACVQLASGPACLMNAPTTKTQTRQTRVYRMHDSAVRVDTRQSAHARERLKRTRKHKHNAQHIQTIPDVHDGVAGTALPSSGNLDAYANQQSQISIIFTSCSVACGGACMLLVLASARACACANVCRICGCCAMHSNRRMSEANVEREREKAKYGRMINKTSDLHNRLL